MKITTKIQLLAGFITLAGLGSVTSAEAKGHLPTPTAFACAFCSDECVADLTGFCHDQGCSASGGSCSVQECEDIDNNFHDYDIECGAAS